MEGVEDSRVGNMGEKYESTDGGNLLGDETNRSWVKDYLKENHGKESVEDCRVGNMDEKNESSDDSTLSGDETFKQKFKDYLEKAFGKRKSNRYDLEAYALSSYILDHNSDFHVMWSFRREILLQWKNHENIAEIISCDLQFRDYFEGLNDYDFFEILDSVQANLKSDKVDFDKIFICELSFTKKCLTKHLKSYATWNHRTSIIKWMNNPPLLSELDVCSDFFMLDPRNFHCWNYRRFICELLYGSDGLNNQLNFIRSMIEKHPDNFSAFHYQSVVLAKQQSLSELDPTILQNIWDNEFTAIQSSLTNLASHQGLWLYFWWLCIMKYDSQNHIKSSTSNFPIYRVILDKDNHNLVFQFNQCLHKEPFDELTVKSSKGISTLHKVEDWHSIGTLNSDIWYHKLNDCEDISEIIFTFSNKIYNIKMANQSTQSKLAISTISELPKNRFDLIRQTDALVWINNLLDHSHKTNSQIIVELNKYFNLTMALLSDDTYFDNLIEIDPLRRNYYLDSKSRNVITKHLKANNEAPHLDLQNLSITCIQPVSLLTHLRSLDLSGNQITRVSGSFNSLVSLQSLVLDNNKISNIDPSFKIFSLKTLSLRNNHLTEKSSLKPCNNCEQLQLIIISGNVIAKLSQNGLELVARIAIQS